MPVELRKRKAHQQPSAAAPAPKRANRAKAAEPNAAEPKAAEPKAKKPARGKKAKAEEPEAKVEEPAVDEVAKDDGQEEPQVERKKAGDAIQAGDYIDLDGFGGDLQTQDGKATSLKKLVDASKAGVIIFTYPKASTPGCTNQACLFRDNYTPFTADGLAIYGLSADSIKANANFKEKQKLNYPLLCDPDAALIGAIGLKKIPKGTQRGVFVLDKKAKVLLAEPGSPGGTVEKVKKLVAELQAQ